MNQLNEEIRAIQTHISTLEKELSTKKEELTENQKNAMCYTLIGLNLELRDKLKQTKEVDI